MLLYLGMYVSLCTDHFVITKMTGTVSSQLASASLAAHVFFGWQNKKVSYCYELFITQTSLQKARLLLWSFLDATAYYVILGLVHLLHQKYESSGTSQVTEIVYLNILNKSCSLSGNYLTCLKPAKSDHVNLSMPCSLKCWVDNTWFEIFKKSFCFMANHIFFKEQIIYHVVGYIFP